MCPAERGLFPAGRSGERWNQQWRRVATPAAVRTERSAEGATGPRQRHRSVINILYFLQTPKCTAEQNSHTVESAALDMYISMHLLCERLETVIWPYVSLDTDLL